MFIFRIRFLYEAKGISCIFVFAPSRGYDTPGFGGNICALVLFRFVGNYVYNVWMSGRGEGEVILISVDIYAYFSRVL